MPTYVWAAKTKKGRVLKGELDAADERIARIQLKKRSLEVTKLKPKAKDIFETMQVFLLFRG
jgi:type IV pilus assembly protein PilC